jgi:hypothetical protein
MKRILGIILVLMIAAVPLLGQNVTKAGTTAASFLNIDAGARGVGMGGAFVSVADDISSMYWNPAGLARMKQGEATFSNTRWIADIAYNYAGVAVPIGQFGTVGVNAAFLTMDEMLRTTVSDPDGAGGETFSAGSYAFGLAYARNLTDRFSIGFNFKYVQERIWHTSASGMAVDIGTLFDTQFQGLKIGMSISNYGTKMQMDGRDLVLQTDIDAATAGNNPSINAVLQTDKYDMPLLFRVGVSVDVLKGLYDSNLIVAVDALHPNDDVEYVNAGLEYTYHRMVSLRAGYKSLFARDSEEGLSFGGGVTTKVFGRAAIRLDYAWGDFGILQDIQKFSLGLSF